MPETAQSWHLSLTDSVYALGAAARELRAAHQHATLTARATDPARVVPVLGLVTTPGAEPARPHDEALWQLSDLYMVLEHHTAELYENAALGYAHGSAGAVQALLRNDRPRHVELPATAPTTTSSTRPTSPTSASPSPPRPAPANSPTSAPGSWSAPKRTTLPTSPTPPTRTASARSAPSTTSSTSPKPTASCTRAEP